MSQARSIAFKLLNQIQDSQYTLDHLLDRAENEIQKLNRADRSLVHALVYGVLRWQGRLDWVIGQLTARDRRIDPMVRNILRLGLFQIQFMQRIPSSAAVNSSVELSKRGGRKWAAGFVNGVLRQAIRQADHILWPDATEDPVNFFAARHSFPGWLIARWIDRWGRQGTDDLCRAVNTIPTVTLRTNTLRVSRHKLMEAVTAEAQSVQKTLYSPEGIAVTHFNRPLTRWEAFQSGWFQVQSEAAQLIGHYLAPRPGERLWDVCAGLGTKTAQLAELMQNHGQILATDLYANKLNRLKSELTRLGITIVQCNQLDLMSLKQDFRPAEFDRILIDAPCSGLGVLQKNPDGKWRVKPKDIENNAVRQLTLLDTAAPFLKAGGILVYAVCSLEPEENEHVVKGFLQRHPEFDIYRGNPKISKQTNSLLTSTGFLSTIPHLHHLDGFFAAALIKNNGH